MSVRLDWSIRKQAAAFAAGMPTAGPVQWYVLSLHFLRSTSTCIYLRGEKTSLTSTLVHIGKLITLSWCVCGGGGGGGSWAGGIFKYPFLYMKAWQWAKSFNELSPSIILLHCTLNNKLATIDSVYLQQWHKYAHWERQMLQSTMGTFDRSFGSFLLVEHHRLTQHSLLEDWKFDCNSKSLVIAQSRVVRPELKIGSKSLKIHNESLMRDRELMKIAGGSLWQFWTVNSKDKERSTLLQVAAKIGIIIARPIIEFK